MTQAIIKVIRSLPYGSVSSYGAIAHKAGYPNGARQVVRILHALTEKEKLAWHRVVNKRGEIALKGDGACEQREKLNAEGVLVDDYGIVHAKFFYDFNE